MRNNLLYIPLILFVLITGCKKSSNKPLDIIKYEIITTVDVKNCNQLPGINYVNETAQIQNTDEFKTGKLWSKTITLNETRRPLDIELIAYWGFIYNYPLDGQTITGNIYVNGKLKATVTNSLRGTLNMKHVLQ